MLREFENKNKIAVGLMEFSIQDKIFLDSLSRIQIIFSKCN